MQANLILTNNRYIWLYLFTYKFSKKSNIYSNIVKYYYSLKKLFSIVIYYKI